MIQSKISLGKVTTLPSLVPIDDVLTVGINGVGHSYAEGSLVLRSSEDYTRLGLPDLSIYGAIATTTVGRKDINDVVIVSYNGSIDYYIMHSYVSGVPELDYQYVGNTYTTNTSYSHAFTLLDNEYILFTGLDRVICIYKGSRPSLGTEDTDYYHWGAYEDHNDFVISGNTIFTKVPTEAITYYCSHYYRGEYDHMILSQLLTNEVGRIHMNYGGLMTKGKSIRVSTKSNIVSSTIGGSDEYLESDTIEGVISGSESLDSILIDYLDPDYIYDLTIHPDYWMLTNVSYYKDPNNIRNIWSYSRNGLQVRIYDDWVDLHPKTPTDILRLYYSGSYLGSTLVTEGNEVIDNDYFSSILDIEDVEGNSILSRLILSEFYLRLNLRLRSYLSMDLSTLINGVIESIIAIRGINNLITEAKLDSYEYNRNRVKLNIRVKSPIITTGHVIINIILRYGSN